MNKMKNFFFFNIYKYNFLSLLLISFSAALSLYLYQYVYDGHHHGLMFSNAVDLLNSKKPFEEIFVQYGLVTTVIHSLSLMLFGINLYSLHLSTIIFYSLSIYLIFLIIKELVNERIALISTFVLLSNHPVPWLPWSNYISYFFNYIDFFFYKKN